MESNDQYRYYQTGQEQHPIPQMRPHRGGMILVFGLVGLLACGIFGLLAWIFGNEDLKKMGEGRMDPSGRDMTSAGRILGIIVVVFHAIAILIGIAASVYYFGMMAGLATG